MPHSRLRIQTSPSDYFTLFKYGLLGIEKEGYISRSESWLKNRYKSEHALSVNQGRVGIYAAVKAAISGNRKKVILSPYTLYEVINMVIYAGGTPVFVDTLPDSTFVNSDSIAELIDNETAAILLTHYHLPVPETETIAELAKNKDIYLIEDAAVSFAASLNGKSIGTFGDAGCFSFGLFKVVNGFYGGAVISNNTEFFKKISAILADFKVESRKRLTKRALYGLALDTMTHPLIFNLGTFPLIRHGFKTQNPIIVKYTRADTEPSVGTEYPVELQKVPSEAQFEIIWRWLQKSDSEQKIRECRASKYIEALSDINEIVIPEWQNKVSGSWTEFPIIYNDRKALFKHLTNEGRDIRYYYYRNCAHLPIYQQYRRDCPNAQKLMLDTLMLPLYPRYSETEIDKNIESIKRFFS